MTWIEEVESRLAYLNAAYEEVVKLYENEIDEVIKSDEERNEK